MRPEIQHLLSCIKHTSAHEHPDWAWWREDDGHMSVLVEASQNQAGVWEVKCAPRAGESFSAEGATLREAYQTVTQLRVEDLQARANALRQQAERAGELSFGEFMAQLQGACGTVDIQPDHYALYFNTNAYNPKTGRGLTCYYLRESRQWKVVTEKGKGVGPTLSAALKNVGRTTCSDCCTVI
jgi:hypothetical protein